jgi:hypothetical protein
MLTQLSTVKTRLGIAPADTQYDALLTGAIQAVGLRFDQECNRHLLREANATQEFAADVTELRLRHYPLEAVSRFDLKTTEAEGWVEAPGVEYLARDGGIVSLRTRLGTAAQQARVTYTGGYVAPGTAPGAGQTALPAGLEQAAIEQVAFWFQNRDRLGIAREWPQDGNYVQLADLDLLPSVRPLLAGFQRW